MALGPMLCRSKVNSTTSPILYSPEGAIMLSIITTDVCAKLVSKAKTSTNSSRIFFIFCFYYFLN